MTDINIKLYIIKHNIPLTRWDNGVFFIIHPIKDLTLNISLLKIKIVLNMYIIVV